LQEYGNITPCRKAAESTLSPSLTRKERSPPANLTVYCLTCIFLKKGSVLACGEAKPLMSAALYHELAGFAACF
jgi:hypothetical protein